VWVEELEMRVPAERLDGYLAVDAAVWTEFLRRQPGFRSKIVLRPLERPGVVILHIVWESRADWMAVSAEACAEVDRRMGDHLPELVACREYEVLRGPSFTDGAAR